ncbi:hypothetical protein AX14_009286 [Amanita brunnescens Koide BX004]|nr:hypothetical protein AX14_009286 [Amanita brunnescens Koide BX004]
MSSPSPPITDADVPYDSSAVADTILCSSDNVYFYVLGGLLRLVSPVFRDMFDLNRGNAAEQNQQKNGFPVIPLMEDSATLRFLLDFLYPRIREPQLHDLTLLWKVCKAAKKYCMDIIEGKLMDRIIASELINQEPLRIYVVAADLEWEDVVNTAVRKSLHIPLKDLKYVEELQSISGAGFYRFLNYRLQCEVSASPAKEQEKTADAILRKLAEINVTRQRLRYSMIPPQSFCSSPTTDLILRSSDSIDFFVIGPMLRRISPVFDGMFPLKDNETKDGQPVVRLQEGSEVLHPLLEIIYHEIDELDSENWLVYQDIVLAVRKYKMISIERKLEKQVATSSLILNNPLRVYILATLLGWKEVQKAAALNTLSQPLSEMVYISELNLMTGADLYLLVRFRFRCGDEACKALEADHSFRSYGIDRWDRYCENRANYRNTPFSSTRSVDWRARLGACPRGSTVTDMYAQRMEEYDRRGFHFEFPGSSFYQIVKCMHNAEKVVEEAVSKVPLELN